jgi:hypothetical protein
MNLSMTAITAQINPDFNDFAAGNLYPLLIGFLTPVVPKDQHIFVGGETVGIIARIG